MRFLFWVKFKNYYISLRCGVSGDFVATIKTRLKLWVYRFMDYFVPNFSKRVITKPITQS